MGVQLDSIRNHIQFRTPVYPFQDYQGRGGILHILHGYVGTVASLSGKPTKRTPDAQGCPKGIGTPGSLSIKALGIYL